MSEISESFAGKWPDRLGQLRPWDLQSAREDVAAYSGQGLLGLIEDVAKRVSNSLPSKIELSDIDDLVVIAAELAEILRGRPKVAEYVRQTENVSPGWRLIILALQGGSHSDLMSALNAPAGHTAGKGPTKTAAAEGAAKGLLQHHPKKVLEVLGAHPADGVPVRILSSPHGPYVRHGSTIARLRKGQDPATVTMGYAVHLLAIKEALKRKRVVRQTMKTKVFGPKSKLAAKPGVGKTRHLRMKVKMSGKSTPTRKISA